jgi:membrane-associated protease RseP (regulator of RpoE activity)
MPSPQPDAYLERLRAVYGEHPQNPHSDFGRFVSIQVLWDETMADTAARYLGEHPDRTLVVLAGKGHVAWGSGIPARVTRRSGSPGLTLVNESPGPAADPRSADHLLLSHAVALAPAGLMGVFLEAGEKGLLVTKVSPGGAAEAAGIVDGENIEAIGGAEVRRFADVKSRLWRERPGTEITLRVRAKGGDARRDVVLVLR